MSLVHTPFSPSCRFAAGWTACVHRVRDGIHIELTLPRLFVRTSGRFELFLDLLFVAIVANFAEDLADHASGARLVKYVVRSCMFRSILCWRFVMLMLAVWCLDLCTS